MNPGAPRNPFATVHHRPGRLPFLLPDGVTIASLADRLEALKTAEITGPHGTGKSTLVHHLVEELRRRGWGAGHVTLHDGRRLLPHGAWRIPLGITQILVVDGAEQLYSGVRGWVLLRARLRRVHVLWTGHAPLGLTPLWTTAVDLPLAKRVVTQVLENAQDSGAVVGPSDVESALASEGGNLRATLLRLYDLYELRTAASRRRNAP